MFKDFVMMASSAAAVGNNVYKFTIIQTKLAGYNFIHGEAMAFKPSNFK